MLPAPSISIPMPRLFLELSLHSLYKFLHNLPIGCRLRWRKGVTSDTYRTKSYQLFSFGNLFKALHFSWQSSSCSIWGGTSLCPFSAAATSQTSTTSCNWNFFKRNWIPFTYSKNMSCDYCSWMCRRMILFVNLSSCFYYHLYVLFQEKPADLAFLYQGYFYHCC